MMRCRCHYIRDWWKQHRATWLARCQSHLRISRDQIETVVTLRYWKCRCDWIRRNWLYACSLEIASLQIVGHTVEDLFDIHVFLFRFRTVCLRCKLLSMTLGMIFVVCLS